MHCDALWCSVFQRVAECHSVLQCVVVCCSVLQCGAVCCSVSYAIHSCVYACLVKYESFLKKEPYFCRPRLFAHSNCLCIHVTCIGLFCKHFTLHTHCNTQQCVLQCVCNDSFISVTELMHTCDMTQSCVWHDSFMCDMTHSYVWHDLFMCVTWLMHTCDMTRAYVWHNSFICVTWLIHVSDITH